MGLSCALLTVTSSESEVLFWQQFSGGAAKPVILRASDYVAVSGKGDPLYAGPSGVLCGCAEKL